MQQNADVVKILFHHQIVRKKHEKNELKFANKERGKSQGIQQQMNKNTDLKSDEAIPKSDNQKAQETFLETLKEQYLNDDGQAKTERTSQELQNAALVAEMKLWIAVFNLVAACIRNLPRKCREMEEEIQKKRRSNKERNGKQN